MILNSLNIINDNFGPIHFLNMSNDTNITKLINNTNNEHTPFYIIIIALFPLLVGILMIIIFCFIVNVYDPIKLMLINFRYKRKSYFENKTLPIVNNKLNKLYIDKINERNKQSIYNNYDCSICISEISIIDYNKKRNTIILDCKHTFHTKCINKWIETNISNGNNLSCPLCRKDILMSNEI